MGQRFFGHRIRYRRQKARLLRGRCPLTLPAAQQAATQI
jgi:hypothetical protein